MRPFVQWFFVAFVLAGTAAFTLLPKSEARTAPIVETTEVAPDLVLVPLTSPPEPAPFVSREGWCEPIEAPLCSPGSECTPMPDGTPRVCVLERWVEHSNNHVCIAKVPNKNVKQWRADRLRVFVDEVCKRSRGCSPAKLHDYLLVLVDRETSRRPYKVHRLQGDVQASSRAWAKLSSTYVNSPAYDEPWRWSVGLGYFGQNPAYLLAKWDATAEPETLCGEVESAVVHLRVARKRWHQLESGVVCDDAEHHGTAANGRVSWYDVSLSNSGSDPCPGTDGHRLKIRRMFERATRARGLDPYESISLRMLGDDVDPSEQNEFAERVRARMDELYPAP